MALHTAIERDARLRRLGAPETEIRQPWRGGWDMPITDRTEPDLRSAIAAPKETEKHSASSTSKPTDGFFQAAFTTRDGWHLLQIRDRISPPAVEPQNPPRGRG